MARRLKLGALAAVALLVGLAGITGWALESGGVAVIETHEEGGGLRITHVWYVERDGTIWLEAGAPENGWVRDVERDPRIAFSAEEQSGEYLARPSRDPAICARLREQLRAKYGLRDRWVGLFVNSSRSFAVRLDPEEQAP
jgi:hypothetical protein